MFSKHKNYVVLLFLFISIALIGCDSTPTEVDDYDPEPVLHAFITVDQPFGEIWLEKIHKNIENYYDPRNGGITGAEIVIFPKIDYTSDPPETFDTLGTGLAVYYEYDRNYAGRYIPMGANTVKRNTLYRIEVKKPGDVDIWAETTTPDTFILTVVNETDDDRYEMLNTIMDVVPDDPQALPDSFPTFSRNDESIKTTWTPAWGNVNYGGESQGGYLFTILALTDTSELVPLDPDWDPDDPEDAIEPGDKGRSTIGWAPDYINYYDIFWLLFEWSGPQRIDVIAGSFEYSRYVFTTYQTNPTTGDISRPESYVHGGLGCFGATAIHSFYLNMEVVE
ncbi:MAG: hypothetical protein P9L92_15790 [Candidatus Electryonea clarkiae]|nr:hypothetical protein [Candidatus Electryonea clarkiae]MDP8285772.1 hypothetical protein [Candidatus Electryonea clarkiae]